MDRSKSVVTPARFQSGMTFAQYLAYVGTPENLKREGTGGSQRPDNSAVMREWYEGSRLTETQTAAWKWLASQPGGPAKILVLSEDWSSDCRRDVPMLARVAEATGMALRIFNRDGQRFGKTADPLTEPEPSPNADIMAEFMNEKGGKTYQSIPVVVFYDESLNYLYHYIELPAIYHKDRVVTERIRAPRPGETPPQTAERAGKEFAAFQTAPFFRMWAGAGIDEMASALHERLVMGSL
ncbi:MAG TPA: thioredoxin family protein [Methylomirabilota bacterium]|nr:thioredoxin family protein [Methylomirabilota bacterium]